MSLKQRMCYPLGDAPSCWPPYASLAFDAIERYSLALQLLREEREKVAYLKSRVDEERRHRRRLEAEVHRLHVFSSPSIDGDATSDVTVSIDGKSYRNVARVNRFALRGMTEDGSLWFVLDNQLRALCSSVLSAAMEGASK